MSGLDLMLLSFLPHGATCASKTNKNELTLRISPLGLFDWFGNVSFYVRLLL